MRIGYDGRLRPAGTAATVNPESQFNAEQIGKIGAAQPKFIEGVMKIADSWGDTAKQVGVMVEKREQRERDLEDEEDKQRANEFIAAKKRELAEDTSLTPEERSRQFEEYRKSIAGGKLGVMPETGDDERDRRRGVWLRKQLFDTANGLYEDAQAAEKQARAMRLSANFSTCLGAFKAGLTQKADEWLAKGVSVDDAMEELNGYFDEVFANVQAESPKERASLEKVRAQAVAAAALDYAQRFQQAKMKEATDDLTQAVSVYVQNTADGDIAGLWDGVGEMTAQSGLPLSEQQQEQLTTASVLNFGDLKFAEAQEAVSTRSGQYGLELGDLIRKGDLDGAKAKLNEMEGWISTVAEHADMRYDAILAEASGRFGDDERGKTQRGWFEQEIKNRKADVEKWRQKNLSAVRKSKDSVEKDVSAQATKAVRKALRDGKPVADDAPGVAHEVHLQLTSKEYWEKAAKETPYDFAVYDAFVLQNFGIDPRSPRAAEAVVNNLKFAITRIEDVDKNLFHVKEVMHAAGALLGYGSDRYREVAAFAAENISKEKNNVSGDVKKQFLDEHFLRGRKFDELSFAEQKQYLAIRGFLDEIPADEFDKYLAGEKGMLMTIADNLWSKKAYQYIIGPSVVGERVESAKKAAARAGTVEASQETNPEAERLMPVAQGKMDDVLLGEQIAQEEAELHVLEHGGRIKQVRNRKLLEYWGGEAVKRGLATQREVDAVNDYHTSYALGRFRERVLADIRKESDAERDAQELPELLKFFESHGLPTNLEPYLSSFWRGGHYTPEGYHLSIRGGKLIGSNEEYDRPLTAENMRSIRRQYEEYVAEDEAEARSAAEKAKEADERRAKIAELKKARAKQG